MFRAITVFTALLLVLTQTACNDGSVDQNRDTGKQVTSTQHSGWLSWRGPEQIGTTHATGLPKHWQPKPGGENHLWSLDLPGRGTPVIDRGQMYVWGYEGEGEAQQEVLVKMDARTGKVHWKKGFPDFISDVIYSRYSIGAPSIDPETGNIYLHTTPSLLVCFSPSGELLWQQSLMEDFGKLTFPNGRTGSPAIDGDLVVVNIIMSSWGKGPNETLPYGPARNRFLAFHKRTGDLVWVSTPGVGDPYLKDSSFSTPVFGKWQGKRVMWAGTGCGNVVCVDMATGQPLWRYQLAIGGVNASVIPYEGDIIAVHGKENLDSTEVGRMVRINVNDQLLNAAETKEGGAPRLPVEAEVWRAPVSQFTSSPVLVDDKIYQVTLQGELKCVDAKAGNVLWTLELANSQLHASPLYGDGKLYVPMWNGLFYIIDITGDEPNILEKVQLEGAAIGSPAYWNGRIYVHTTQKLYCFGEPRKGTGPNHWPREDMNGVQASNQPLLIPAQMTLQPGEARSLRVWQPGETSGPAVKPSIVGPASGQVTVESFDVIRAKPEAGESAGMVKAGNDATPALVRTMGDLPYQQDFENTELSEAAASGEKYAHPPLPWIGARAKWVVKEKDGSKVLAKTTDVLILQRAQTFIGPADSSNYTIAADVMTDGNRRLKSNVGVINQRYRIVLKGQHNALEVSSNLERLAVQVPFEIKPGHWYRVKARVNVHNDGSGEVLGKAWVRGEKEPQDWTIRVPVTHVHQQGAPGLFGFAVQNRFAVYADNIEITAND